MHSRWSTRAWSLVIEGRQVHRGYHKNCNINQSSNVYAVVLFKTLNHPQSPNSNLNPYNNTKVCPMLQLKLYGDAIQGTNSLLELVPLHLMLRIVVPYKDTCLHTGSSSVYDHIRNAIDERYKNCHIDQNLLK